MADSQMTTGQMETLLRPHGDYKEFNNVLHHLTEFQSKHLYDSLYAYNISREENGIFNHHYNVFYVVVCLLIVFLALKFRGSSMYTLPVGVGIGFLIEFAYLRYGHHSDYKSITHLASTNINNINEGVEGTSIKNVIGTKFSILVVVFFLVCAILLVIPNYV